MKAAKNLTGVHGKSVNKQEGQSYYYYHFFQGSCPLMVHFEKNTSMISQKHSDEELKVQVEVVTKRCTLCEKSIPVDKFRLHDVMCYRQNYKCKVCGGVVPKGEKEMHDLEVCG